MSSGIATTKRGGTFAGGIHPKGAKSWTDDQPIEVFPSPAEVRIALLQHLGAPCQPAVKPRANVTWGDVIGDADGFVSAPVHASISGVVSRSDVATLPNGRHVTVIPIRAEGEQPLTGRALFDTLFGGPWPTERLDSLLPAEIADAARSAGLVGLGGAGFPTHVKLTRNAQKPVDTLLVNGCECEPYLTADYRLMLEAPQAVVAGVLAAMRATGATQAFICVEDNKPIANEMMERACVRTPVRVCVLPTKYPQGGERQLILAALGRRVPGGALPLDVGVVVINVATSAALAAAVWHGRPLTHRVVSVAGAGIRQPKNLLVPLGVTYGELITYCGGVTPDAARVVAGGPMMGFTLAAANETTGVLPTPVTKGTSGITILTSRDICGDAETACLRCARCVQACPMGLVPTKLALAARRSHRELLARYHALSCIECGCCAYTCPARIPLVQLIRVGKLTLQNK